MSRLVRKTAEEIRSRKWSEEELESFRRMAAKQAADDDSDIDYSDIPPLTDEELARMVPAKDRRKH